MKITTLWADSPDGPALVSAYDEWRAYHLGGQPNSHLEAKQRYAGVTATRELVIHIPDHVVAALFRPANIEGTVEG